MGKILKLAMQEIRKKKFFALLMFLVCLIAMHTVLTSITNATSAAYQQKIFENSLGYDMTEVLHLDYPLGMRIRSSTLHCSQMSSAVMILVVLAMRLFSSAFFS